MNKKIAVLIPCLNEEKTIYKVVKDFKSNIPESVIYVYDNMSDDNSIYEAKRAGAIVKTVSQRGKGIVVRRMFREIDADIYILVDGDSTYNPQDAITLIRVLLENEADMVIAVRNAVNRKEAFKRFHRFGNWLLTSIVNYLFKANLHDVLSGYRCLSKRFVKGLQMTSKGFDIEVKMTIKALENSLEICEIESAYFARPIGSSSKLRTFRDGFFILTTIFNLFKNYYPLRFFVFLSIFCFICGLLIGLPVIYEYWEMRYVYKVPSAVLASSLEILSMLFFVVGLILDNIKDIRLMHQEFWLKRYNGKK